MTKITVLIFPVHYCLATPTKHQFQHKFSLNFHYVEANIMCLYNLTTSLFAFNLALSIDGKFSTSLFKQSIIHSACFAMPGRDFQIPLNESFGKMRVFLCIPHNIPESIAINALTKRSKPLMKMLLGSISRIPWKFQMIRIWAMYFRNISRSWIYNLIRSSKEKRNPFAGCLLYSFVLIVGLVILFEIVIISI